MGEGKPLLSTAVICERVIQENDGTASLIRLVDRVNVQVQGSQVPGQMPPIPVNLTAFISFRSGSARGRFTVTVTPRSPVGLKLPGPTVPVLFEGEDDRGVNLVIGLNFQTQDEGLFWFDVLLDGELLTRMPLRIVYQPVSMNQPPQI